MFRFRDTPAKMETEGSTSSFPETRWSVILDACDGRDRHRAERALAEICRLYWKPLYAYARWRGSARADAEDLTQSFFADLLEGGILDRAIPGAGRLRAFLLGCFNNHIHNTYRANNARKRGGGAEMISISDIDDLEHEIDVENRQTLSPDQIYDRQCALMLVRQSIDELEKEQVAAGRGDVFRALRPMLDVTQSSQINQNRLAEELGVTHGSMRTQLSRMRHRFREIVRDLVRDTLSNPSDEEINSEVEVLRRALEG